MPNANTKQSVGEKLAIKLVTLTDKEKALALAMIQGMQIGKQLAEQNQNKSA